MRALQPLASLGFVLLLATQAQGKDLVLRQNTSTVGPKTVTSESTQYWTDKLMVSDDERSRIVVDFEHSTMTWVDKSKQAYFVLSFDAMKKQMDLAHDDAERRAEGVPPEARQTLERMGEPLGEPATAVEVKPTGKTETIAGYLAREYTFAGPAVTGSLWITDELPLPLTEEGRKAFRKSMDGMKPPGRQFALAMLQLNRVPLRTVMNVALGPDGTTTTNEVVEVREASPPAEVIGIPDGFHRMNQ